MLSKKIEEAFNRQINAELYSAYLYLSMSAAFQDRNLPGMANWMRAQALEEMTHAEKFANHVNERGGRVVLAAIDGPPTEWDSPLAMFGDAYEHETKVTALINDLVDLAIAEKDHAANNFLQWFVGEQVEEEDSADQIVQQLKMVGDDKSSLFMLDREMGQRAFSPVAENE
ncbi:MAG: ferritin [Desulfatibacillaceae bacterium]